MTHPWRGKDFANKAAANRKRSLDRNLLSEPVAKKVAAMPKASAQPIKAIEGTKP